MITIRTTHQCRIIVESENSESVRIDGISGKPGPTYGRFYHVRSLDRVELSFGCLARNYLAHLRRQKRRIFFITHIDDRGGEVSNAVIPYLIVKKVRNLVPIGKYPGVSNIPLQCRSCPPSCDRM